MRKRISETGAAILLVAACACEAIPVWDDFQSYPVGQTFTGGVSSWSSDAGVVVTSGVNRFSNAIATNSVVLGDTSSLTNGVNSNVVSVVWTDFYMKPVLGDAPVNPPTNTASHVHYYDTNGYVVVSVSNGWVTCSNDVWGHAVPPVTGTWVHVSIFQDYSRSNTALLINDQVVIQDLPFTGTLPGYGKFITRNSSSNAALDDVWIATSCNPVLVANHNGDTEGLADAQELQRYGYVARTQFVGVGTGYPRYPSFAGALAAWRARDTLYVHSGSYAEDVALPAAGQASGGNIVDSGSVTLGAGATLVCQSLSCSNLIMGVGARLSCLGNVSCVNALSMGSGAIVDIAGSVLCGGTLSVAEGASVSFSQNAALSAVTLAGTMNQQGGTLTCGSLDAAATAVLDVADGATFRNTVALSITSGGRLELLGTGSTFISTPASLSISGPCVLTNNLSDLVALRIPFVDTFESYGEGTALGNLGFRGWSATAGVVVTNASALSGYSTGRTTTRAVYMPDGTSLSNSIMAGSDKAVWTDYYMVPHPGTEPSDAPTGTATFVAYVNTNGWLVVATTGGWVTCSQNYTNGPVTPMASDTFCRLTIYEDFSRRQCSVFLDGVLLRDALPLAAGGNHYSSFQVRSGSGVAYVDDVHVITALPDSLPLDINANGVPDALEIQLCGAVGKGYGSIYRIR